MAAAQASCDRLTNLLRKKELIEWHTHWNGILSPMRYIDSMFPLEGNHNNRCKNAKDAIMQHFFPIKFVTCEDVSNVSARGHYPEGMFKVVRWLYKSTNDESIKNNEESLVFRTKYVLAAQNDTQRGNPIVNWSWAYTFRSIIRKFSEIKHSKIHSECHIVDLTHWDEKYDFGDLFTSWYCNITKELYIDVDNICHTDTIARTTILQNIINMVNEYDPEKKEIKITLSLSTVRFLYAVNIFNAISEQGVIRCEVDGKPKLSSKLIADLYNIETSNLRKIQVYFLYGIDTVLLRDYTQDGIPRASIETELISKKEFIGTDFRGPEPEFTHAACKKSLVELYQLLVKCKEIRRRKGWNEDLIMRIHVGESDMYYNKHNPALSIVGRKNIDIVLDVISNEVDKSPYFKGSRRQGVMIRLGHITACTVSQCVRMRRMDIGCELNLRSNLKTYAAKDERSLPILVIFIADLAYQYWWNRVLSERDRIEEHKHALNFNCNTDGAGVMDSNIVEDYQLAQNNINTFMDNPETKIKIFPVDRQYIKHIVIDKFKQCIMNKLSPGDEWELCMKDIKEQDSAWIHDRNFITNHIEKNSVVAIQTQQNDYIGNTSRQTLHLINQQYNNIAHNIPGNNFIME